ncbi:MAG: 6-pyruvoyl tetrahydropterin synthase family protein [Maricaulaceae bacterium]
MSDAASLRIRVSKRFQFDAAHHFEHEADGHPFSRLHGHSFEGLVELEGVADPRTGFVEDLWRVEAALQAVVETLDHRLLNEVEGLGPPSLEHLALYVFNRLKPTLAQLSAVEIGRPSCGERARIEAQ